MKEIDIVEECWKTVRGKPAVNKRSFYMGALTCAIVVLSILDSDSEQDIREILKTLRNELTVRLKKYS